jgi:hypothetical protein
MTLQELMEQEIREEYEILTTNEKEIYFELVHSGCDRLYVLDLLWKVRRKSN